MMQAMLLGYGGGADPIGWGGDRGVFVGGWEDGGGDPTSDHIDRIDITTLGNATHMGYLGTPKEGMAGCSNGSVGLFAGGVRQATRYGDIEYVNIWVESTNAGDFGDLEGTKNDLSACSNGSRGIFAGGNDGNDLDIIEYVAIDTAGNASDFGDLTQARERLSACGNSTRGIFAGGAGTYETIDYITIASTGNATDFGDLNVTSGGNSLMAPANDETRAVFAGGRDNNNDRVNVIQYVTMATTGNSTDFGDLTDERWSAAGTQNPSRGIFAGGMNSSGDVETADINYVVIQTTGNASSFGDLTVARRSAAAASGAP